MKSFKNIVAIGLLAVPLAYSEGVLAFDARERVSRAWQNYIKPAASWTLSSRPVKGVGALISAGAASAAVGAAFGAAGAGVSYAATRHGAASQYVGAGVGALAAFWFLNEFGGITARAAYAKMNGQKLSDRYEKEKKELEQLIFGTMGLVNSLKIALEHIKVESAKIDSNNSDRAKWVAGRAHAIKILDTFVRNHTYTIDDTVPFAVTKKSSLMNFWQLGLAPTEQHIFESAQLTDKEIGRGNGLLDGTKTILVDGDLKKNLDAFIQEAKALQDSIKQLSEGALTNSPENLVKSAQAIVDISSRHIQSLSAALWRVEKALQFASFFHL